MSAESPLISIVLPAYKHAKYLPEILQDIKSQSLQDFELLVADDQSNDGSDDILERGRELFAPGQYKCKINEKRLGPVENLNQLIAMARGKWIAVCNSDDKWSSEKLFCQMEYLKNHPDYVGCFSLGHLIFEDALKKDITPEAFNQKDLPRHKFFRNFWEKGNFLFHPSLVIKKEVYGKVGYYDAAFRQLPDYEFYIRMIKYGTFGIVEKDLVGYRRSSMNSSSVSALNCMREITEYIYIYEHFFDNVPADLFYDSFQDLLPENSEKSASMISAHAVHLMKEGHAFKSQSAEEAAERYCFSHFKDSVFTANMEKYGFSIFDFYHTTGKNGWGSKYVRMFPFSFRHLAFQLKMLFLVIPGNRILKPVLKNIISFFKR